MKRKKKKDVNPDDFRQKEPSDADPKDEMEENIAQDQKKRRE